MKSLDSNSDHVDQLRSLLFGREDVSTYAVLDGASVPGMLKTLYAAKEEWVCLYRGQLDPDLAEVAPYLVKLREKSELTDWILSEGWGNHWGVFALSEAGLEAVRRHFRKFLRVKDSSGKVLYFRYYDPRVLRIYLPTCNYQELKTIYGQIWCYVMEDENPSQLLWCERARRRIKPKVIPLEADGHR